MHHITYTSHHIHHIVTHIHIISHTHINTHHINTHITCSHMHTHITYTHIHHTTYSLIHTSYHIHTYTSHTYTHRDIMTGAREMAQQVKGLQHKHEPLSADSPATRNRKVDMEDTVCSHTAGWIPRAH